MKTNMATLTVQSSGYFPAAGKTIPVIHNVVSDKDLSIPRNEHQVNVPARDFPITKVLKLITDKHSKHLVERHGRAIHKLYSFYKNGIHLRDVFILKEIFTRCHENIILDGKYEDMVCSILSVLGKPFLKVKASDETEYQQQISGYLTEIAKICEGSTDKVCVCLATNTAALYTAKHPKDTINLECQPVSSKFIKKSIEKSRVCKSIAECLSKVSDKGYYYILLKSLNILSTSELNCDDILKTDAALHICKNLTKDVSDYKLIFVEVEILWNLLEYGNSFEFSRQLGSEICLRSLLTAFVTHINHCSSHADQQLRNDLLVLVLLITSKCPSAPIVATGIAKMVSLYSTYPEVPSRHELVKNVKIRASPEDFELKKLLFSILTVLAADKSSVQVMRENHVIHGLFSYTIPITHLQDSHSIWSLSEFEELQLLVLSLLAVLGPLCTNEYMACQGGTRLLTLLDWCVGPGDFGGHGNSFHGTGGRGSKRAQMRYCVRLIRSMCSAGGDQVCQDFTDQGLITQLVVILRSCSQSPDSNDDVDIELQCDMLFILATLCDADNHRKELFGEVGVKMLVQYLDGYVNIKKGPLDHNKLVLSAIYCIWASIINCHFNEMVFLEKEGAFLLLDLLETCPDNIHNVILGTLLDLLENKNVLAHIMLWRGKHEKTVGKLLVDLWRAEEKKLGVAREDGAIIADISCPLKTLSQVTQAITPLPTAYASPSIVEVSDNLRAKVYGVFSKIGFNNLPGLCSSDYMTVAIVERYLDFKTLEVWQEIETELQLDGIEPVATDKEGLGRIISILQGKATRVRNVQKLLIQAGMDQDLLDEEEFYQKIKESYTQQQKQQQDWISFVDRTSDYYNLQKVRERQLKSIDRSRLLSRGLASPHRRFIRHETLDRTLTTTTFCGRDIFVQSTRYGTASPSSLYTLKQSSTDSSSLSLPLTN